MVPAISLIWLIVMLHLQQNRQLQVQHFSEKYPDYVGERVKRAY